MGAKSGSGSPEKRRSRSLPRSRERGVRKEFTERAVGLLADSDAQFPGAFSNRRDFGGVGSVEG